MNLDIGGQVKTIMSSKEISQKQLSRATGIKQSFLAQIQSNKNTPSVENLVKLADALYCTTDILLGR